MKVRDDLFLSPLISSTFDPDFVGPVHARSINSHFLGNATGRMPNPQSNNHQSRDGSGSGDRGRTFRPIEVSGRCARVWFCSSAGRQRGLANRRHCSPIQFFNPRNHPRACCDRFTGNDARADGMRTNDHQLSIKMHWNWCRWFVMPMGRRLEPGTVGTVAAQKQTGIQFKKRYNLFK